MPIAKSAVKAFMNRKLKDYGKVKKMSESRLDKELAKIDPMPVFDTPPMKHQKAAFLCGWYEPRFLWYMDMGLGKTFTALNMIRQRKRAGLPHRALVVVPRLLHCGTWQDEIATHTPELKSITLDENTTRWDALRNSDFDVCIINIAGLVSMLSELQTARKKKKQSKERRLKNSLIKEVVDKVDGIIIDEIQKAGNHTSLQFKATDKISSVSDFCYGMTGTPFGRHPQKLWSEFYVVDRGETLGKTLTLFRQAFYNRVKNAYGFFEWKFLKTKHRYLARMIRHKSIRYKDTECQDLPQKVYRKVLVEFPHEAVSYYQMIQDELKEQKGKNYEVTKNSFLRMRQITAGFLSIKENVGEDVDRDPEKIQIEFPEKPKVDAVVSTLETVQNTSKVVIFHEYTLSGRFICEALEKEGYNYEWVYGQSKDPIQQVKRFQTDPECKVLVINNAMGAESLNLQVANYMFFFESPVPPDVRNQAEKRIQRKGQRKEHCFYYDFVTKDSVDEKILSFIAEGEDLMNKLIDNKTSV